MVCPYCKKKMSDGYIPAIQSALMWIPDNEKVPLFVFSKAKGGVNFLKGKRQNLIIVATAKL